MSSTENSRRIIKAIYDAAAAKDIEKFCSYLAPDFVIVEASSLPYGGRYEGALGFKKLSERLYTTWAEPGVASMEYIAEGGKVIAKFNLIGKSATTGRPINMPIIELWHVEGDLATFCQPYYFDTHEVLDVCGLS